MPMYVHAVNGSVYRSGMDHDEAQQAFQRTRARLTANGARILHQTESAHGFRILTSRGHDHRWTRTAEDRPTG